MYGANASNTGGERAASNVWRDTSEEEAYGSYLGPLATDAGSEIPIMRPTMTARPSGSTHHDIAVGQLDDMGDTAAGGPIKSYSGRKVVWPGALFLLFVTAAALSLIAYFGVQQYTAAQMQQSLTESVTEVNPNRRSKSIKSCLLPDYIARDGRIYAKNSNTGEKVPLVFTGINWSGMENSEGVPHGLATKQSYLDDIAANLSDSGFNAVRLPLNAHMIIENLAPKTKLFVNSLDTDMNVDTYIDMIKKVVQGLGKQQIGVLLDIHKINPEFVDDTSEHLWFTEEYPITTIYKMFETLATELCSDLEYNIVGIDIKNEPVGGCWPANDTETYCDPDINWPRAVETIGNKILAICPNWLIVAEGIYEANIMTKINGKNVYYSNWYGASLQNASVNPIVLDTKGKLVYAPHFYSPSVYPAGYFFEEQSSSGDIISVTEYPNTTAGNKLLTAALTTVLDNTFGNAVTKAGVPMFYGEFGGIFGAAELLAGMTSTRTIEALIEYANKKNMTGGFVWAANPDGEFHFNDVYRPDNPWKYGLYTDSKWEKIHTDFANGLKSLRGTGAFPCFSKTTIMTTSGSGGASTTITLESAGGNSTDTASSTATTTTAAKTTTLAPPVAAPTTTLAPPAAAPTTTLAPPAAAPTTAIVPPAAAPAAAVTPATAKTAL